MIRPPPDVVKAIAITMRQYPEVLNWLGEWQRHELDRLPNVTQNVAFAQGRCQVLGEIYKLAQQAPDLVAEPTRGS